MRQHRRMGENPAKRECDVSPDLNNRSKLSSVHPIFSDRFSNQFIGKSEAFESILKLVDIIASRRCPVIISGETGVGKEMVARQIHFASNRADKPFIPVDCTTLTGQLQAEYDWAAVSDLASPFLPSELKKGLPPSNDTYLPPS